MWLVVTAACDERRGPVDAGAPSDPSLDGPSADGGRREPSTPARSLLQHERWATVDPADDPFEDRPRPPIACAADSAGSETLGGERVYFVRTDACEYLTVAQPSRTRVAAGASVVLRAWLFALTGPAGAEAHLALRLGPHTVWEERIPIPSAGRSVEITWRAPTELREGTPVVLHVHNHGSNEYALISLQVH